MAARACDDYPPPNRYEPRQSFFCWLFGCVPVLKSACHRRQLACSRCHSALGDEWVSADARPCHPRPPDESQNPGSGARGAWR